MRKSLLLKLADYLDTIPKSRFNICVFFDKNFSPNDCGTKACACGWATVLFSRSKLKMVSSKWDNRFSNLQYIDNHGMAYRDFRAAAKFFDIPHEDSEKLFFDNYTESVTPKTVAKTLRKYVKENGNKRLTFNK